MPASNSFDGRLFHLKGAGKYTPKDLFKTFTDALDNPKLPDLGAFLFGVSGSESPETGTANDIKSAVQFTAPYMRRFSYKCAVLVKSDLNYSLNLIVSILGIAYDWEPERLI